MESEVRTPTSQAECRGLVDSVPCLIPRGLGRSYGDSANAGCVLDTKYLDFFHDFDSASGVLTCSAGVSLDDLLRLFVPRGWFLPVVPGTRYVTVGGAIASDVHGKNHHVDGSFSQHVDGIEMLLGNGELVHCSRSENTDLFHATCGGMGLTGVILSASLRLHPITSSDVEQTILKASCLEEALGLFEQHAAVRYSVAWIDCLAGGKRLGRSLLMLGEHAPVGKLKARTANSISMPAFFPAGMLNSHSIRLFNAIHYSRPRRQTATVPFEPFFFPLDQIANWNRMYGKKGFLQYQFVLPKSAGLAGLKDVLSRIARSGKASFLAVLKVFGKGNEGLLSFPIEGYTLALDFKVEPDVFALLDELDQVVLSLGGRIYLAKDARMSEATFKASYRNWPQFEEVRERCHAVGKFASAQSKRLGLQ